MDWEDSLEKAWQPTPVFLSGKSHEKGASYTPWVCKELDMTEATEHAGIDKYHNLSTLTRDRTQAHGSKCVES